MSELSLTELANLTGLSRKTVYKRIELSGITQSKTYESSKTLAAIYSYETASLRLDRLTKTQLATITGYSPNTVKDRLDSIVEPDEEGFYNGAQAIAAIFDEDKDNKKEDEEEEQEEEEEEEPIEPPNTRQSYERYRTDYMRAKAEREQLTLDKERGRYVLAEEVKEKLGGVLRNLRTRLLAIPQRITQTLAPGDDNKTIEKKVSIEVETALNELSRLKL